MKRFCLLFIGLMVMLAAIAQSKLNVAPFFDTKFVKSHKATMVKLSGESLREYGLLKFHSVTMGLGMQEVIELEQAVTKDVNKAVEQESASKHGRLTTAFINCQRQILQSLIASCFIETMDFNLAAILLTPLYIWKGRPHFKNSNENSLHNNTLQ